LETKHIKERGAGGTCNRKKCYALGALDIKNKEEGG